MNMMIASSPAAGRATYCPPQTFRFTTHEEELISYSVMCLPAHEHDGNVRDWSFRQLDEIPFKARLTCALAGRQVRDIFAPTVDRMSGVMLPHRRFTRFYPLNRTQTVKRPGFESSLSDQPEGCDGTTLASHEAFAMSAAGCPLIVLTGKTRQYDSFSLVAHAGRESLIDRQLIVKGKSSRPHFSIVDAMVACAEQFIVNREDMVLRSFFAIPWQKFPHSSRDEKFGVYNSRLLYTYRDETDIFRENEDGEPCLDLSRLIELQAQRHGIGRIETGLLTLPIDGDFAYTTHSDPALRGTTRNLVLVVRT